MLKEVILSLNYMVVNNETGKESKKSRRFNQVRMDLTDQDLAAFKNLISSLTGELYITAEKIETKAVMA